MKDKLLHKIPDLPIWETVESEMFTFSALNSFQATKAPPLLDSLWYFLASSRCETWQDNPPFRCEPDENQRTWSRVNERDRVKNRRTWSSRESSNETEPRHETRQVQRTRSPEEELEILREHHTRATNMPRSEELTTCYLQIILNVKCHILASQL